MNNARPPAVRFGRFALDFRAGELLKNGRKVVVQEQPLRVLVLLVEHAGDAVTREELRRTLWPNDTVVEFDHSINAAIRKLRIALGDSAEKPRYIETMGRRGYRFIARLESTGECAAGPVEAAAVTGPPAHDEANLIGRRVSHYRVLEVAGGGGMGLVYKAEDIRLGRRVALKFLAAELASDALTIERFEREARSASALDHRNICPVYEFGEHEHQRFIVMPFLEGATLRHRLDAGDPARTGIGSHEFLDIAIQIAEGLDAAHRKGIIHRDIKPGNIFIILNGEVKILDFGVAKLVEAAEECLPGQEGPLAPHPASHTRTGATVGTASYMSPEQVRCERLDTRTDLFSFGLVLYEMATGQQAFVGQTAEELREAILSRPPAEPRNTVPGDLWKIIAKAIEKDRDRRYQTALEVRGELARLQRKTAAIPKERIRRWLAFCVTVLLAVMAVLWVAYRRPVPHPGLVQRKLTTSSADNWVFSGLAISPDGRRLAYSDAQGMQVKLLQTGETRSIPQPEGLAGEQEPVWAVGSWFPDGTRFLANAHPPGQDPKQWSADGSSIWAVPAAGPSQPYKLRDHAEAWAISPNGKSIAFGANPGTFGDREIWTMDAAGGNARKLYETGEDSGIGGLQWSADAQRVIYLKNDRSVDTLISRALKGGPARTLLSAPASQIHDYLWLADGRLLYILAEPGPVDDSCNIWRTRIDPGTGELAEPPVQATNWAGFCLDSLSATADSKHLVITRWAVQTNVLVASVADNGKRLGSPTRLTRNDNFNSAQDWTADGKAVIVGSNRNGAWGLFRHSRESDAVASLVTGAESRLSARVSPDGAWILYAAPRNGGTTFMRLSTAKDVTDTKRVPEKVMEARSGSLSCPTSGDSCAFAEPTSDRRALIFSTLHPLKGRGQELARFDTDPAALYDWNLSPDGARIAVLRQFENEIHILTVGGRVTKTIAVKGLSALQGVNWRADGTGLLSSAQVRGTAALLSIDLQGNWRVLWQQPGSIGTYAVPSRDGRYLAIQDWRNTTNIWMLENF